MKKKNALDGCAISQAPIPHRIHLLETAARLTGVDRQKVYGDATTNMTHFAAMLTAYFENRFDLDLRELSKVPQPGDVKCFTAEDAAMIMVLAKLSRVAVGKNHHEDNYIDSAAYIAIASECRLYQEGQL